MFPGQDIAKEMGALEFAAQKCSEVQVKDVATESKTLKKEREVYNDDML